MPLQYDANAKKGRLSVSINQSLLDRLEPYKQQINFAAQAEQWLAQMPSLLRCLRLWSRCMATVSVCCPPMKFLPQTL